MPQLTSDQFDIYRRIRDIFAAENNIAFWHKICPGSRVFIRVGDRRGCEGIVVAIAERETLSRNGIYHVCRIVLNNGTICDYQPDYLDAAAPLFAMNHQPSFLAQRLQPINPHSRLHRSLAAAAFHRTRCDSCLTIRLGSVALS